MRPCRSKGLSSDLLVFGWSLQQSANILQLCLTPSLRRHPSPKLGEGVGDEGRPALGSIFLHLAIEIKDAALNL
jgi:hypothetical protein